MSRFCGKCDLYDELFMINNDEQYRRNSKIYIGFNSSEPIKNECDKDLVPYYPFVCCAGGGDASGWVGHYTEKPYFDIEEEHWFTSILKDCKDYYKKCKRKKIEFTVDGCVNAVDWLSSKDDIEAMAKRVLEHGLKAKAPVVPDELHSRKEFFRKELYDAMVEAGYTAEQAEAWCYHNKKTW